MDTYAALAELTRTPWVGDASAPRSNHPTNLATAVVS